MMEEKQSDKSKVIEVHPMERLIESRILTNEERRYFALEPILPDWERFEIKPGFTVYFDGDTIRKTISCHTLPGEGYENFLDYTETDHVIQTRGRETVLPRTRRGREKKLSYTSISAMNPTGCTFQMNLTHPNQRSMLYAGNTRNSRSLPIVFPENVDTLDEFHVWLSDFMDRCPTDYFDKVDRVKYTPHHTVKYFNGDIFRFEVDLEHYGFGLIIGQIKRMKNDGLLPKEHILCSTMGVPLLVRLYRLKTKDKNLDVETIVEHSLGKTFILMDNPVIWGVYDIIGNKVLDAADIDFPIQVGKSIDGQDRDYVRICWGTGMIVKRGIDCVPERLRNNGLMRHGCHFGVSRLDLERVLESGKIETDLSESEQAAFRYFDIPLDITFDEFNRQHHGMTLDEYADYANKAGKHT